MKNAIIGILLFLVIALTGGGYYFTDNITKKYNQQITYCDSLRILANKPPITTVKDSIIYKDVVKWRTKFDSIPSDFTEMKEYRDSLINDSINLRVKIYANNLYYTDYTYTPIIHNKTVTIEKTVPLPIIKDCPELPTQKALSIYAGLSTQLMPVVSVGYKKINISLTYSNGKPLGLLTYKLR